MGFFRRRSLIDGAMVIDSGRYWEVDDGSLYQRRLDTIIRPIEGQLYEYRVEKTEDGGVEAWDFWFDDNYWMSYPAPAAWIGVNGDRANWSGEVHGHESDMPGRNNYRCYFTDCAYDTGYGYKSANFYEAGIPWRNNSDPSEWELQKIDDESFDLWDKNPLSGF